MKEDLRKQHGNQGEEMAAAYLKDKGYAIVCRNYRCPVGEIDLVARDGEYWVFVEVRSRWAAGYSTPEQSITKAKKHKLWQLGAYYLQNEIGREVICRFDLIGISAHGKSPVINHIKGILS